MGILQTRYFKVLIIAVVIGMWFLLLGTGFWLLYPYNGLSNVQAPFPVLNEAKTVKQGEILRYRVTFCKNSDRLIKVTRKIQDGIVFDIAPFDGEWVYFPAGCQTFERTVQIPKIDMVATPKKIIILVEDRPNPIRVDKYTFETEPFTIVK